MLRKTILFAGCFGVLTALAQLGSHGSGKSEYRPVNGWLKPPEGFRFGGVTALAVDKDDNLHVFHRGKQPIAVFDKAGKFLRSWGDDLIKTAHGLQVDRAGNVWVTDIATHQVIQFDPSGKVLLTLGKKNQPGTTRDTFNKPADVAFGAEGEIYVADGYGNSRVVKFDKTGKYLLEWGKRGKGVGEFHIPHAIFIDRDGKIHVGDRENDRVQVFDASGKFLEQWRDTGAPFGLYLQPGKNVLLADGRGDVVRVLDTRGKEMEIFGKRGTKPGQFRTPHGICADSQGAIYVAEVENERVQKFVQR